MAYMVVGQLRDLVKLQEKFAASSIDWRMKQPDQVSSVVLQQYVALSPETHGCPLVAFHPFVGLVRKSGRFREL